MELAVMEQVLKEILQQQKEMTAQIEKESEARQQIFIKMEAYEKKLDGIKLPANDPLAILSPVKKWIEEVRALVEAQPKTVVQEKRFQVFPNWPVELYKLIFKGLIILIVFIYGLVVINRWNDLDLFLKGRYSEMSENAQSMIRKCSALSYRELDPKTGVPVTDVRLMALKREKPLKDMWERMIEPGEPINGELLSMPGEETYINMDLLTPCKVDSNAF